MDKVYYDKKYNRFFHVLEIHPRSVLTGCLTGFYDTISTTRYNIPKSYLKTCELLDDADNKYTEFDNIVNSYRIKGYDCLVERDPTPDEKIFKYNKHQSAIAQYRWDKKNGFWEYDDLSDYDDLYDGPNIKG